MSVLNESEAIKIEGLYKKYRTGQFGASTLLESLENWLARKRGLEEPNLKIGVPKLQNEEFWALQGIDLSVNEGDRLGIIGSNGAGKSTLLKLICRITAPTAGSIAYRGRITSMLEVGTGFNPEMTGRENIYLNGTILGLTERQIDERLDEIIEFSEVADFIDTPVKRYSSGMYVKLAFSVTSHFDSEIMIMDEVLAVGDAKFREKCMNRMLGMAKDGKHTILFVSHNREQVEMLCNRAVVLKKGRLLMQGSVKEAFDFYENRYNDADV
ncbi:MAG: ABC transporter ATP-binding protein [Oscillospiraceae bacterium]|nr:ABC transporter ATP-binding protein [Oscillospiraceae bacterium]